MALSLAARYPVANPVTPPARPERHRHRGSKYSELRAITEYISVDSELLRDKARWIRDDLDPCIAQKGPSYLNADTIISLVEFFDGLGQASITLEQLKWSRMHFAVLVITARATRWPEAVIEEADKIAEHWKSQYGPLTEIRSTLYEEGGRLHGVCAPDELDKEVLELKWLKTPGSKTVTGFAFEHGHQGWKPGDWWINTMFAYHAGMLESGDPTGRIIYNGRSAYGIILTNDDEPCDADPREFVYPTRPDDPGRYRLTSARAHSRQPLRVFRTHTLRSSWAPRAGIRYDGLYTVTGWSIYGSKEGQYDVTLKALDTGASLDDVFRRPCAEEMDDYFEYKRMSELVRKQRDPMSRAAPITRLACVSSGPDMNASDDPGLQTAIERRPASIIARSDLPAQEFLPLVGMQALRLTEKPDGR